MASRSPERRKSPRKRVKDLPAGIRITARDADGDPRVYAAKLIDASEGGIGVEMYVPLAEGARVELEADLSNTDLSLGVSGRARVVYVKRLKKGTCRVGLAFEEVVCRKTA